MIGKWLNRFHWYKRYPNSYPKQAITSTADAIIIFIPKYTFIIPFPQFWVDRNIRKWLEKRGTNES